MNQEIVTRIEQSFLLPEVTFPTDLVERMESGSSETMARARAMVAEEVVRIFKDYFPPPPRPRMHLSPDELYQMALDALGDVPEEDRSRVLGDIVASIRKAVRNPRWMPAEPGISRYLLDTWEGRDLAPQDPEDGQ